MAKPSEMVFQLKELLESNPLVAGLVLVGSQVKESVYPASQYSDMEVYVIVEDEGVEKLAKQLPKLVNKLGRVIFSYKNQWAGFSAVFEDLFRLELPVVKTSELSSVFSKPKAQVVKVLIDKTDGKLEKTLKNRPQTIDFQRLFQDKVADFWYMIVIAAQYYKKGEIYNSRSALQISQSSVIKLLELLNNSKILLLESNKRIEQFLEKKQIDLLKEISPAYDKKQIKTSLKRAIEIFPKICEKIAEKYRYQYRREIKEQVKPKLRNLLED